MTITYPLARELCPRAECWWKMQGIGIEDILEAVVERIPAPADNIADHETRALIFDSAYDPYRVRPSICTSHPKGLHQS